MPASPPADCPIDPAGVPVEWRRHQRARWVSLRVDPAKGVVIITLPPKGGRKAGLDLLRQHATWIAERRRALPHARPFVDGGELPFAGEVLRIRHEPDAKGGVWISEAGVHVSGDAAFLSRRLTDFLRAEAGRRIGALARVKAAAIEERIARIAIKDTVTRWGSCAPDGTLAFCWRLVMAPVFVQDYVSAHEVAHLRHMNHGPKFWDLVAHLTPHRREAVAWLRREGPALLRVGRQEPLLT